MKKISLFTVFLFLLASAIPAMAGSHGKWGGKGGVRGLDPSILSQLNLTPEQSEKIRSLHESHLKEVTPIRTQLFNKRAELRLLWMQTNLEPKKIGAVQKEVHDLRGQLEERAIDYRISFRKLLTPEQLSQYITYELAGGHGKRKGKIGRGGGRRQGPGIVEGSI